MTVRMVVDASVSWAEGEPVELLATPRPESGTLSTVFEISDEAELAGTLQRARDWCQAEVRRQNRRRRYPHRAEISVTKHDVFGWRDRVLCQSGQVRNTRTADGDWVGSIRWSEPTDHTGRPLGEPRPAAPPERATGLGLPEGWEARGLDGPRPEAYYRRRLVLSGESEVFAPDVVASFCCPAGDRETIKWGVYIPNRGGQIAYGTAESPVEAAEKTLELIDRFERLYLETGNLGTAVQAFRAESQQRSPARASRKSR
ncbi:hypothetical protein NDR87_36745 [Nocardia sp. CDC159]|uniref:Uncharacterized protein n=1 Tax=Nocardia pulmonis TaxID=2951408 RepID=A0A9X2J3F2_9NOCA|nr:MULTISPECIES: hypothetical protein [Nocardia]MCM6779036.1 hypothetical protein [Nocardia pulmonis]MCM6791926.1 hypothetical protein [Nocardia sp. CDC159]